MLFRSSKGYDRANTLSISNGFPRALIGSRDCAGPDGVCPSLPPFTFLAPLAQSGAFIGYRPGEDCFGGRSPDEVDCAEWDADPAAKALAGNTLYRCTLGNDPCEPLVVDIPRGSVISAIAVSPDRTHLAVATEQVEESGSLADRQTLQVLLFGIGKDGLLPAPVKLLQIVNRREDLFGNYREMQWEIGRAHV